MALTEMLLIVLVPTFCLVVWALCDSEFQRGLLAGPKKEMLSVNPVYDAVNLENDTILTVQGQGQMRIWDLKQSVMISEMQSLLSEVRCVAYSAQERLVAVGSAMGTVEIWDLNHPESPIVSDHDEDQFVQEVSDCLFTGDGRILLTAGEDGKLILRDSRTLELVETLSAPGPRESIRSLGISRDSKLVIAGTHTGMVQIWDLERRELLHVHRVGEQRVRPDAAVEVVDFLADGKSFVTATRVDGVATWDVATGNCILKLEGAPRGLRAGVLSGDQTEFAVGTELGDIVSWDLSTGRRRVFASKHSSIVRSLAYSADRQVVLGGDWDGRVKFHNTFDVAESTEIGSATTLRTASPL